MRRCERFTDCDRKHYGRGLCNHHWLRAHRLGWLDTDEVRCLACGAWWDVDCPDTARFVAEHPCWSRP